MNGRAFLPLALATVLAGFGGLRPATPASATVRTQMDEVRRLGEQCAAHETKIPKDYAANSDPSDDAGWTASEKALRDDAKLEKGCDGKDDYVNAYLASWHAQILHHQGQDWKAKLDEANSLLSDCAAKNTDKMKAAQCDADLKANNQRATTWGAQ
jgi:hypothetical protein